MAINATVGSSTANSYMTIEAADAYFSARLGSDAWHGASAEEKSAALQQATSNLDDFSYVGYRNSPTQALNFPRAYPYNDDPEKQSSTIAIPTAIRKACCEEALYLLQNRGNAGGMSERQLLQAEGVRSFSTLGLSESYGSSAVDGAGGPALSTRARGLIRRWISMTGEIVADRCLEPEYSQIINLPAPRD